MADWTTIPDASVDPKAPVTSELMTALRDNPVAIVESASGAPSIRETTIAGTPAGAIGSFVFAGSNTQTDHAFGDTVAGSSLVPVSIAQTGTSSAVWTSNYRAALARAETATTLSGTWRCLGNSEYDSTGFREITYYVPATLWMRIS